MEHIKSKLESARRQRETLQDDASLDGRWSGREEAHSSVFRGLRRGSLLRRNVLYLLSLGVVVFFSLIAWWSLTGGQARNIAEGTGGAQESRRVERRNTLSDLAAETDRIAASIDAIDQRLKLITDSVTYLESKLIRAHVITDSIMQADNRIARSPHQETSPGGAARLEPDDLSPPAAGIKNVDTTSIRIVDRLPDTAARDKRDTKLTRHNDTSVLPAGSTGRLAKTDRNMPAVVAASHANDQPDSLGSVGYAARAGVQQTEKGGGAALKRDQPLATMSDAGQWVINLASLPNEVDAERFMQDARSRGVVTSQQKVMIAGKPYWRVQTHGFTSSQAARSYSETIKRQLGLKDVWIMKRLAR